MRAFIVRWRGRVRAAWPAIRARAVDDGGLRSLLILVLSIGKGASAYDLAEAAAPVAALACGCIAILLPEPQGGAGRARSFLLARLAERGTWRSLGALALGIGMGASAETLADHIAAVGVVVIGAISAARPAPPPPPPSEKP